MLSTPDDVASLKLACRTFASEISDGDWHSKVTYEFPSTVALIDVLSRWSREKLESVRHIRVLDSPLPLFPYNDDRCYHTYAFDAALPMFPRLQLDTRTVDNWWLYADGMEVDGWCGSATAHAVTDLLFTSGWKKSYYISGVLGLAPSQGRKIVELAREVREKDFYYEFRGVRPNISHLQNGGSEDEKAEVEAWYAERPDAGMMDEYPDVE